MNGRGSIRGVRNPVTWVDGACALAGLLLLAALGFDWSGGGAGFETPSALRVLLGLIALGAVLLPFVLFATWKPDLPVVWETTLFLLASILLLVMIGKAVFPPDGGLGTGFWLSLVACFGIAASSWTTVSREA